jgi:hypothetical protein
MRLNQRRQAITERLIKKGNNKIDKKVFGQILKEDLKSKLGIP